MGDMEVTRSNLVSGIFNHRNDFGPKWHNKVTWKRWETLLPQITSSHSESFCRRLFCHHCLSLQCETVISRYGREAEEIYILAAWTLLIFVKNESRPKLSSPSLSFSSVEIMGCAIKPHCCLSETEAWQPSSLMFCVLLVFQKGKS